MNPCVHTTHSHKKYSQLTPTWHSLPHQHWLQECSHVSAFGSSYSPDPSFPRLFLPCPYRKGLGIQLVSCIAVQLPHHLWSQYVTSFAWSNLIGAPRTWRLELKLNRQLTRLTGRTVATRYGYLKAGTAIPASSHASINTIAYFEVCATAWRQSLLFPVCVCCRACWMPATTAPAKVWAFNSCLMGLFAILNSSLKHVSRHVNASLIPS